MVLVHIHKSVLRVNQSKVRRDHDPWHDVAVPLNPEPAAPQGGEAAGSRDGALATQTSKLLAWVTNTRDVWVTNTRDGAPEHSHLCSGYQCKCCFEHEIC